MVMLRAARSEWRKLWGRRSTRMLLLGLAALPPTLATGFGVLMTDLVPTVSAWIDPETTPADDVQGLVFESGGLLCLVVGMLVLTSEYATGAIRRTYEAFPTRLPALGAKLVTALGGVLLAGCVATPLALALLVCLGDVRLAPRDPGEVAAGFLTHVLLSTALGYALALLLSRSLATLIAAIGLVYVLPDVVRILVAAFAPTQERLHWFLPGEASRALLRSALQGDSYSGMDAGLGLGVTLLWILALLGVGLWHQARRDVAT